MKKKAKKVFTILGAKSMLIIVADGEIFNEAYDSWTCF